LFDDLLELPVAHELVKYFFILFHAVDKQALQRPPEDVAEVVNGVGHGRLPEFFIGDRDDELAQETLRSLLAGHFWRYADAPLTIIAGEQQFSMPIRNPATRSSSRTFDLCGKIDAIVKLHDGRLAVLEYKTAGEDIGSAANYWLRLRCDQQISTYVLAARHLGFDVETVLYDATRKPTIAPKQIPALDAAGKKIVEDATGTRIFKKDGKPRESASAAEGWTLKTTTETPAQFGTRVLADIGERPDYYYARREIARLQQDLDEFAQELWEQAGAIRDSQRVGRWYRNVGRMTCEWCPYATLCLIPDFQFLMLPMLEAIRDGKEHHNAEITQLLTKKYGLTDDELRQMLPSGQQTIFTNRVAWAKAYLKRAGLLEHPERGSMRITSQGQEVLATKPDKIDTRFLKQFSSFDWFNKKKPEVDEDETPEELLEASHQTLREQLAADLLDRVKAAPPVFFEQLVVKLLVAMGYGGSLADAGQVVGKSGDGGIDGIIKKDKLGLEVLCIQAKRWENVVGRPVVQAFAGSMDGIRAMKGVMITTSSFSKDAQEYVKTAGRKIVLIDGEQLTELMIDHDIGVTTSRTYAIKKVDPDFFSED